MELGKIALNTRVYIDLRTELKYYQWSCVMKRNLLLVIMIFLLLMPTICFAGGADKVLKGIVTLVFGATAVVTSNKASKENQILRHAKEIKSNLKKQGYELTNEALFSVFLDLNNDASSLYWADIMSKPDVYIVVSMEGQNPIVIPSIYSEYAGTKILESFIAKQGVKGGKCVLTIYDDDTTSNTFWNSILKTKVKINIRADLSAYKGIPVVINASTNSCQLLDRNVTLDSADVIASAVFNIPSNSEVWSANIDLIDSSNRSVGKMSIKQLLTPVQSVSKTIAKSENNYYLYIGITLVTGIVFLKLIFSKSA